MFWPIAYVATLKLLLLKNVSDKATYALTWNPKPQDAPMPKPITPATAPWFLNQLLVPGMAFVPGGGRLPENYRFFSDYVGYQSAR